MKQTLILALLLVFHSSYALKTMAASYTVKYDGIPIGKSTTTLNIIKNQYNLCINNQTTLPFLKGFEKECSMGLIFKNQIRPISYDYIYSHKDNQQKIHIDFDWEKHNAIINANQTHWHLNFPDNTQDRISCQLLLRQGLSNHQKNFSFPVADGGKIKTYQFKIVNINDNLIQVDRMPLANKENVSLWFMKNHDFIIAKVKQNKHFADILTAEIIHAQI